ncbi:AAA family ATPase [Brachyspira hyodysenteriae]|uniref:Pyrrolo-quinoline quinone n=1 Tax=Brachyspira hyodysenteriae (strain ATCC 49526 / WA1) TaxID=565034 RepID=A0A3B6VDK0_BRAHW|nr:AAA family ATPase [Brachyspira hyodysenteriae]ACN82874.1 Pyrrolo-quinoline quinone [Brachyspira hyodysenteriae WA1]KLI29896.1 pyrrolo-quinoline quinone [Brachyspira hyodysenteriae]KLI34227.1 pyrrolo-quinoline quinone [Brachyspira hyodysenteriae]KLI37819.1 pyrrolo-quinoline quinone [Brachyspira hyodysenteriae]KLI41436.1 pyrrolo-quinoline quinone [Brachyspira hyodysenteriae]
MKNTKSRIEKIIKLLSEGLYEREEIVSLTLLSAIAGKPIFLYGPPGTAKSFIAKRVSSAFKNSKYFGYLMQRFSTPEDIFGPISLEELKNDKYIRKIEGYLPDADFAFLDEIWKSTPAILNTLLTIINERVFKNGSEEVKVPLKALISASNETPPEGQGLEALYDRFIVRLMVNNIKNRDNFEKILENTQLDSYIDIDDDLKISADEWISIRKEVNNIKLSKSVIDIIHNIKLSIEKFNEDNRDIAIYVSDRRWQHISYLLKTAAYLNDKNEVDIYETILIYNCLWSLEEHIEVVKKIVENAISLCYDLNNQNINEWRENFKSVQKNIDDEFYNLEKTYDTENIDDKPHMAKTLSINIDEYGNKGETIIYIPIKQLGKKGYFYPLDIGRNQTRKFRCNFNGTDKCTIEINSATASNGFVSGMLSKNYEFLAEAEPDFYMKKVSPKKLEKEKKDAYLKLIKSLISTIENIIVNFKNDFNKNKYSNKSIFISDDSFNFFTEMFNSYIENLESEKLDAERLKSEIEQHETI